MTETSFCSHFVSADEKGLAGSIAQELCEGLWLELKSVVDGI
jgi:hypothetical protein